MKKYHALKLFLLSLMFLPSFFFTACQKDEALVAVPDPLPQEAKFTRQFLIADSKGNQFAIEVGASDQALLGQLKASHFSLELNPEPDNVPTESCLKAPRQVADPQDFPRLVTMQVLGVYTDEEINDYEVHFSPELGGILTNQKAMMRVILTPSNREPITRISSNYKQTGHYVELKFYGNHIIPTNVRTHGIRNTGSHVVVHNPPFSFLHSYYCDKCSHSGIVLIEDFEYWGSWLPGYHPYTTCGWH